ncbi:MAG: GNAT family N-acetyltransferase [Flavobacterium sp.]|nr:MAG: GNAT family N-acetyltransferase [Flavobacterium sp.]
MFVVKQYKKEYKQEWDSFVKTAKNATFLFQRDFMDYHSDRFEDFSLMVYKGDKLYALLPANKKGNNVISHQGLTYGSFVLQDSAKLFYSFNAFKKVLEFLYNEEIKKLDMRVIPSFYNNVPSDELEYILFKANAKTIKSDVILLIDYKNPLSFIKSRRQAIRRGAKNNLIIKIEDNYNDFWNTILIPNMYNKYKVKPIHSLNEIKELASKFPENIKQFNVYKDEELVAGSTIFITKTTIHPQYISANIEKNTLESLDFLYNHIINLYKDEKSFFDFNTSSEDSGNLINKGIIFWKESFGARPHIVNNYLVETSAYKTLEIKTT